MFTNFTILFLEPNNEYSKNATIVKCNSWTCSRSTGRKVVSSDERMEIIQSTRGNLGPWGGIELPCTYYQRFKSVM